MSQISTDIDEALARLPNRRFARAEAQAFLDAFGATLGLEPLEMSAEGAVDLLIDDEVPLSLVLTETLGGFIISSPLGSALGDRPDLLAALLRANLDPSVVAGGCFARIPPMTELVYCALLLPDADDLAAADTALAVFLDRVRRFRDEIDAALLIEPEDRNAPPRAGPQVWA